MDIKNISFRHEIVHVKCSAQCLVLVGTHYVSNPSGQFSPPLGRKGRPNLKALEIASEDNWDIHSFIQHASPEPLLLYWRVRHENKNNNSPCSQGTHILVGKDTTYSSHLMEHIIKVCGGELLRVLRNLPKEEN